MNRTTALIFARAFLAACNPLVLVHGPYHGMFLVDRRLRYWPPHRRVGTPPRAQRRRIGVRLVGGKGMRP